MIIERIASNRNFHLPLLVLAILTNRQKSAAKCGVGIRDVNEHATFILLLVNEFIMSGDNEMVLRFAKLSEKAFAPTKGSEYAAGYDLRRYVVLE